MFLSFPGLLHFKHFYLKRLLTPSSPLSVPGVYSPSSPMRSDTKGALKCSSLTTDGDKGPPCILLYEEGRQRGRLSPCLLTAGVGVQ